MGIKEITESYKLDCQEYEKLEGYASINYRVKCKHINYLLKHYSDPSEFNLICQEEKILSFLSKKELSFKVPSCIQEMITYEDNSFSRLLPFIEGDLLSSIEHSESLLLNFGKSAGTLNQSLIGVNNDTIQARELFWDMKHTMLNEDKVDFIQNPQDKKLVTYFLDLFEHDIIPIQKKLRHGIIHSDLNDNNVIVENGQVKGLIDFGDITYSPLIYEVAIAVTYIMLSNEIDPFKKAQAFIKGYDVVLPLKKEEIELLYILIPSRLCVSLCNSAKKKAEGQETEYTSISEKPAWNLLRKWISINPKWITDFFLETVGLSTEKIDSKILINKREKFTGKSLGTSYNEPIYMIGGAFQYMYDNFGNTYLDAYNNIPHIGHNHPSISKVISTQVRKLNTNTRYLYPELGDYAEELSKTLPNNLHKIFYVNSGSAASDLAIRMVQTHTNKNTIAILENGYHGNTISGIAISDYKHNGKGGKGSSNNIISLPLPKMNNGSFDSGEEYARQAIQLLEKEILNGNRPAALIVEPISGCGGQVPLAEGYLKLVSSFLKKENILLIVDEVQTGFGRLGKYFWGFEMHLVIPDIVIMGKPMGNGHPVAAVVTTDEIANSFANGMEFFTSFGGNPVSCKVALQVLKTLKEENLQNNALKIGNFLKSGLTKIQNETDCIGDVRGEGLFLGVEFQDEKGNPSQKIASFVKEDLKKKYVLVGTDGPANSVIKIKPPLCFNEKNATDFLVKIKDSVKLASTIHMKS